jgi:hypothetical protein
MTDQTYDLGRGTTSLFVEAVNNPSPAPRRSFERKTYANEELASEKWLYVPNYGNRYAVSSLVRVVSFHRSKEGYLLSSSVSSNGYEYVNLCSKGASRSLRVHRLVALLFLPNPARKPVVNHIDANRLNTRQKLSLKYGLSLRQILRITEGLKPMNRHSKKVKESIVSDYRTRKAFGLTTSMIAHRYGLSVGAIKKIAQRANKPVCQVASVTPQTLF